VRWYGVAYVLGFIAGGYAISILNRRWRVGLSSDEILSAFLWGSIGLVVGARLGFMIFYAPAQFIADPVSVFYTLQAACRFTAG
jgi:phosphatidylglycerol---prolipoprotein diacylglyceryl transferase